MDINKNNKLEDKMYRAIVQFAGVIIFLLTDSGKILYANNEAIKSFGYTEDELFKMNIDNIISYKLIDDINENLQEGVCDSILSKKEWCGELCSTMKNGCKHWNNACVSTIIDDEGQIRKIIFMGEDTTEKRYFNEEISKKNNELKDAAKSLDELKGQLAQSDKMACIGYLSAGIAHEINNPLGFVSSNFNTLKKYLNNFTEYITEYRTLKKILEEGKTVDDIILEEIADINALEARNKIDFILKDLEALCIDTDEGINRIKNIVVTLKEFLYDSKNIYFGDYNINKGIEDTLIIVKNEIKYNIHIETDLEENIRIAKTNCGEMNQVLLNLIINASHAVKEKCILDKDFQGIVKIITWSDEEFIYCSIEDNGTGISEDNIKRVFNPFFTTKPIGVGTGLGLSISYDIIVNKHKGDIKIESNLGEGTKLIINLPLNSP